MEIHPSNIFLSMLLALVQGVLTPKTWTMRNDQWAGHCAELLVSEHRDSLAPKIPGPLQNAFKTAVKRSFIELVDVKNRILKSYPPDRHDYFFVDADTVVLGALFRNDPKLKQQSYHLPLSMIGYGDGISIEESKGIFRKLLQHMNYKHEDRAPIFVMYYKDGTQLEDFDFLIRHLDDDFWKGSELAILGSKIPEAVFHKPAKLGVRYSLFPISNFLESLLYNQYYSVFGPTFSQNFGLWNEAFKKRRKPKVPEKFQTYTELAEILKKELFKVPSP